VETVRTAALVKRPCRGLCDRSSGLALEQGFDLGARRHGGRRPWARDRNRCRRGGEAQGVQHVPPLGQGRGEPAVEGIPRARGVNDRAGRHRGQVGGAGAVPGQGALGAEGHDHAAPHAARHQVARRRFGGVEVGDFLPGQTLGLGLVGREVVAEGQDIVANLRRGWP